MSKDSKLRSNRSSVCKMGRKSNKSRRTTRKPVKSSSSCWNFLPDAGPGCHIARHDTFCSSPTSWVIEWETVDPADFSDEDNEVPDVAVDSEERTLSLCNIRDKHVVAYLTVFDTVLRGADGRELERGRTVNNQGVSQSCTTLIVLCPPFTFAHLCYLDISNEGEMLENLKIESDVQEWKKHPNPSDTHLTSVSFPFRLEGGPYLCTQGEGGQLTHFFAGNQHALDFRCPVGTPLLAVGHGTVIDVKDTNAKITGVAVSNLFEWNSVLVELDGSSKEGKADPLFVEYVHIQGASVQVGDKVKRGQVIATSGTVGFSPEPHLHFCAYRSPDMSAPTVRVYFHSTRDPQETFLPRAGQYYDTNGLVEQDGDTATNDDVGS